MKSFDLGAAERPKIVCPLGRAQRETLDEMK
jgi:hypothetical protein